MLESKKLHFQLEATITMNCLLCNVISNWSGYPPITYSTSLYPRSCWHSCRHLSSMFQWILGKRCPFPSQYCCRSQCFCSYCLTIRQAYHKTSLSWVRQTKSLYSYGGILKCNIFLWKRRNVIFHWNSQAMHEHYRQETICVYFVNEICILFSNAFDKFDI